MVQLHEIIIKTTIKSRCGRPANSRIAQRNSTKHAFTLIELLVVIAIVAMLTVTFLPALAKGKYPSMTINCVSNFKQWTAMCNVYASDDPNGMYPSFTASAAGGNPTDVSTNFIYCTVPYGMTVQMYFCPVRADEWNTANYQFRFGTTAFTSLPPQGRNIQTIDDLILWFKLARSNNGMFAKMIHEFWIPRKSNDNDTDNQAWPSPTFVNGTAAPWNNMGWPRKQSDKIVGYQPIISDEAEVYAGRLDTNANDISPSQAHFYNGVLSSINVGYGDGHVETHLGQDVRWQYAGQNNQTTTFY
jgi:prepilin-type N-terminal cleavage/methylation domain-containing protein/prepilin-type processing-associated H-X9-DG protein